MEKNTIRNLRVAKGLKMKEFSTLIGISRQSLSSIENGKSKPSITTLKNIAVYFNCSIEELL